MINDKIGKFDIKHNIGYNTKAIIIAMKSNKLIKTLYFHKPYSYQ
jgi:hypothetical protein